jgi:hypothetical protein
MTTYDWVLPDDYPRCLWADLFYRTTRESIFSQISGQLTPELVAQLQKQLQELRTDLLGRLTLFHYAAASGPPHQCVDDVYLQAVSRLKLLALTRQTKKPVQPEEPQPLLTPEQVYKIFEGFLSEDTFFGEERESG